jgi:uncharacterized protein YqjF (DUF2071 family)
MTPTLVPPTLQQRLIERTRPEGTVVMLQRWEHLLFLHWRYDIATVQATLPPGLTVDPWNGSAWVGLVPLFMRDVRPRFVPPVAMLSDFLELNVRTYVYDAAGRPGIYFYSLDCDQPLVVETARGLLHLRYEHATMEAAAGIDGWVNFEAQRTGTVLKSRFRYRAFGPAAEAVEDTIDFFLIERYRLFATDANGERLTSVRVCHAPYRIRAAEVTHWGDAMLRLAGFAPPEREPDHACAADSVEVEVFAPHRVE